jgi:plasmid stabilization system protein ParE
MMKKAKLRWTRRVNRDITRCRQFLRRTTAGRPIDRIHEVLRSVRWLRENPCINPVRRINARNGLPFRRHNVGQFVIVYVYFSPTPQLPDGMISIRAIRHAREEDVFWGVKDSEATSVRPRGHLVLLDEG